MIESKSEYTVAMSQVDELVEWLSDLSQGRRGDQCTMVNVHRKLSKLHNDLSQYLATIVEQNLPSSDK